MSNQLSDPEKDKDLVDGTDEVVDDPTLEDVAGGDAKMDLPTALAALEDARRKIRDVNRESAGRRKEIAGLKGQLDAFTKTGDDATKQLATIQAQLQEANTALGTYKLRDRFDDAVAKAKIPFATPVAARDAFTFARDAMSKLSEDATEEDLLDIVQDVVKARPYLLNKPASKNINSEDKGKGDAFSNLDLEAIGRDFGIIKH